MNKSTTNDYKTMLQDCLECFKRFDINAYEENGRVYVETSMLDIFVQISEREIIWRADQYLELQKQDNE